MIDLAILGILLWAVCGSDDSKKDSPSSRPIERTCPRHSSNIPCSSERHYSDEDTKADPFLWDEEPSDYNSNSYEDLEDNYLDINHF